VKDYSQNGETTAIADIIATIEKDLHPFKVPKVAVEFGAGDGFVLSNIRGFMEEGWMGVQYDREPANPFVDHKNVTAENVNEIREYVGGPIGVFSIDVDGNDLWIWKAMKFDPCIVCIEFNPTLSGKKTIPYNPDHHWNGVDDFHGASFNAIIDLGREKSYKAILKTSCNVILVRSILWPAKEPELTHKPIHVWPESDKEWLEV
jgi:hypothetical protein